MPMPCALKCVPSPSWCPFSGFLQRDRLEAVPTRPGWELVWLCACLCLSIEPGSLCIGLQGQRVGSQIPGPDVGKGRTVPHSHSVPALGRDPSDMLNLFL